jgi:hypothetical protein
MSCRRSVTMAWLAAASLAGLASCSGESLRGADAGATGGSALSGGASSGGASGAGVNGAGGTSSAGGRSGAAGASAAGASGGGGRFGAAGAGGVAGRNGAAGASAAGASGAGGRSSCAGLGALDAIWSLPGSTVASTLAVDSTGNVFVTGAFEGTVTFGANTLVSNGGRDIFLVKYDPSGMIQFAQSYGNAADDDPAPGLAVDASGNVFLSGFFSDTLSFGGGTNPLVAILVDAFTVKISSSGQTLWADHFGYNGGPYDVAAVAIGPSGDPIIAGSAGGTIQLGGTTWMASSSAAQPFVARLASADGSVIWSNAAGGDFDTDQIHVAVDAAGRTFVVGEALSGAGAWGGEPASSVGFFCTFRVGFDPSGNALWSQFDLNGWPVSAAVDSAGRLSVVEETGVSPTMRPTVGTTMFSVDVDSTLSLLLSPIDGTLISGDPFTQSTFPWAATVDAHGNTLITGQFSGALTVGATSLNAAGAEGLFVAALDGASLPENALRLGAAGNTEPQAIAAAPSGKVLVAATTDTAFSTAAGNVAVGAFIAVFDPDSCDDGAGPLGPSTGSPSDHGDLPDGSVTPPADAGTAACPATMDEATNGAACPVAMGCSYDTTCCFCKPSACGAEPTTWTCDPLGTPDASCPASPPSAGAACPQGVQCNYCLPGGRYFATCTAGGWSVGYAQLLCN